VRRRGIRFSASIKHDLPQQGKEEKGEIWSWGRGWAGKGRNWRAMALFSPLSSASLMHRPVTSGGGKKGEKSGRRRGKETKTKDFQSITLT